MEAIVAEWNLLYAIADQIIKADQSALPGDFGLGLLRNQGRQNHGCDGDVDWSLA